jgi:hypothetical protein
MISCPGLRIFLIGPNADRLWRSIPPQIDAHLMPGADLVRSHRLDVSVALLPKKVDVLISATQMD